MPVIKELFAVPNPKPQTQAQHTAPQLKLFYWRIKIIHDISIIQKIMSDLSTGAARLPAHPAQWAQFCRCVSGASAHSHAAVVSAVPPLILFTQQFFQRCLRYSPVAGGLQHHATSTHVVSKNSMLYPSQSVSNGFCIEPSINVLV